MNINRDFTVAFLLWCWLTFLTWTVARGAVEVHVTVPDRIGKSIGSGVSTLTANDPDNYGLVLTAAHVVRDAAPGGRILLQWFSPDAYTYARIHSVDAVNDIAALVTIPPAGYEAAALASTDPAAGTEAWLSGWQRGRTYSRQGGRVHWGYQSSAGLPCISLQGAGSIQGQSGGPIYVPDMVVGIVSASGGDFTIGPPASVIRKWLEGQGWVLPLDATSYGCSNGVCAPQPRAPRQIIRRNPRAPTPAPALRPVPRPKQQAPAPTPATEPAPAPATKGCDCDFDCEGLLKQLKQLQSTAVTKQQLEAFVSEQIAKLPAGISEQKAIALIQKQLALHTVEIDPRKLAGEIEPYLPPLKMQVIDEQTGSVIDEDTQPLGGTFKLRLILMK